MKRSGMHLMAEEPFWYDAVIPLLKAGTSLTLVLIVRDSTTLRYLLLSHAVNLLFNIPHLFF